MELLPEAFAPVIREIFEENGLSEYLSPETEEPFRVLAEHLLTVNEHMNLTAIRTVPGTVALHFADSLLAAAYLPERGTVLDVGCGAGFPSLPLAIVRRDLQFVGLDSTEKKVRYLNETAALLGLSNYRAVAGRAEELARDPGYRERFDAVTARAVARLRVLNEITLPFLKPGKTAFYLKSKDARAELAEARHGFGVLGAEEPILHEPVLQTPDGSAERAILCVRKIRPTPGTYPRRYTQIEKNPL